MSSQNAESIVMEEMPPFLKKYMNRKKSSTKNPNSNKNQNKKKKISMDQAPVRSAEEDEELIRDYMENMSMPSDTECKDFLLSTDQESQESGSEDDWITDEIDEDDDAEDDNDENPTDDEHFSWDSSEEDEEDSEDDEEEQDSDSDDSDQDETGYIRQLKMKHQQQVKQLTLLSEKDEGADPLEFYGPPRFPFLDYQKLHVALCAFISDASMTHHVTQCLPKLLLKQAIDFGKQYGLKTRSQGAASNRYVEYQRQPQTAIPASGTRQRSEIDFQLKRSQFWRDYTLSSDTSSAATAVPRQRFKQKKKDAEGWENGIGPVTVDGLVWWTASQRSDFQRRKNHQEQKKKDKQKDKHEDKYKDKKKKKKEKVDWRQKKEQSKKNKSKKGKERWGMDEDGGQSRRTRRNQRRDEKPQRGSASHGKVVGAEATPIHESNVGHKLLQKMGWKPGQALGNTNQDKGLVDPIEAVMRAQKRGLGA